MMRLYGWKHAGDEPRCRMFTGPMRLTAGEPIDAELCGKPAAGWVWFSGGQAPEPRCELHGGAFVKVAPRTEVSKEDEAEWLERQMWEPREAG